MTNGNRTNSKHKTFEIMASFPLNLENLHHALISPLASILHNLFIHCYDIVVFVASKSLSKWLQNLKDLFENPWSLCSQGGLGGEIKNRNILVQLLSWLILHHW